MPFSVSASLLTLSTFDFTLLKAFSTLDCTSKTFIIPF